MLPNRRTFNFLQKHKILIVLIIIFHFISFPLFSDVLESQDLLISYHKNDYKIAKEILYRFSEIIPSVNREVGFYPDISEKINLILCHSKKDFKEYILKFRNLPENSEAFAIPQKALIIIRNPKDMQINSNFFQVLTHEYNHLLLHNIAKDISIPLWFDEGFAQYFAKQWDIKREFMFVKNGILGNLLDLNLYYYNYPEYQDQIDIFYMQSYYTFKYLIHRFSKEKFQDFLDALQNSTDFERTFFEIFEISLGSFIIDARNSIKTHAILTIFYSGFGLFWIILPLLLLIAYIRKRLLGKKVEEVWEGEEYSDKDFPPKENGL